jgi:hypothetical protein
MVSGRGGRRAVGLQERGEGGRRARLLDGEGAETGGRSRRGPGARRGKVEADRGRRGGEGRRGVVKVRVGVGEEVRTKEGGARGGVAIVAAASEVEPRRETRPDILYELHDTFLNDTSLTIDIRFAPEAMVEEASC